MHLETKWDITWNRFFSRWGSGNFSSSVTFRVFGAVTFRGICLVRHNLQKLCWPPNGTASSISSSHIEHFKFSKTSVMGPFWNSGNISFAWIPIAFQFYSKSLYFNFCEWINNLLSFGTILSIIFNIFYPIE